jgi:hypothetical protein
MKKLSEAQKRALKTVALNETAWVGYNRSLDILLRLGLIRPKEKREYFTSEFILTEAGKEAMAKWK